jgi:RimJ/RimL family protein N-acetyltransferase
MPTYNYHKYLDADGRLAQWPSKQQDKLLVLAYVATKFDHDTVYAEPQVNEVLKRWHTFSDWPLLRRELVERGWLERNVDSSNYHLMALATGLPQLALVRPNIDTDPADGVRWLDGPAGRDTLRRMGNTDAQNQPSTLEAERQRVMGFIVSSEQIVWMLRHEGQTVGAIWIDLLATEYLPAPSIHIMIGDPAMRQRGIGLATFTTLINQLRAESQSEFLYSRHLLHNQPIAKLFDRLGFVPEGAEYSDADGLRWQNVKRPLQ